jgi:hypothetical protein
MSVVLLANLEGRLLAIDGIREAYLEEKVVSFNKAIFLVSFGLNVKMGTMMLWGEEINAILNLRLGQDYQFVAGLELEGDLFFLYFLPGTTRFEEIMQHAFSRRNEVEINC